MTHTRWTNNAALRNQWDIAARCCGLFLWVFYTDLLTLHGAKELKRKYHVLSVRNRWPNVYGERSSWIQLMHITHVDSNQFIGAFQPDAPSLFGPRPSGAWRSIGQNTCLSLLEKIQPMVAELCKQRIINRYR